jgi:hypothetical protein
MQEERYLSRATHLSAPLVARGLTFRSVKGAGWSLVSEMSPPHTRVPSVRGDDADLASQALPIKARPSCAPCKLGPFGSRTSSSMSPRRCDATSFRPTSSHNKFPRFLSSPVLLHDMSVMSCQVARPFRSGGDYVSLRALTKAGGRLRARLDVSVLRVTPLGIAG